MSEQIDCANYLDFSKSKIAVIGDCMLDVYHYGTVDRISPEAPIPIFKANNSEPEYRLGGSCNTALNLKKLGVQTSIYGFIGKDINSSYLLSYVLEYDIDHYLFNLPFFPTITKNRYLAKNQQIIRIDYENTDGLIYDLQQQNSLIESFRNNCHEYNAVILSDYGKGALYHPVITCVKEICKDFEIPVFIDPKLINWEPYRDVFCITPNWVEFKNACHLPNLTRAETQIEEIDEHAQMLCYKFNVNYLLITMGKFGMILIQKDHHPIKIETVAKDIYDVSGAGDTVIATLVAAYTKGYPMSICMKLANLAAKVVIGKLGTYAISHEELTLELLNSFHSITDTERRLVNGIQI